jgi:hypothetical protein
MRSIPSAAFTLLQTLDRSVHARRFQQPGQSDPLTGLGVGLVLVESFFVSELPEVELLAAG